MYENKLSEIIKSSLDGIRDLASVDAVIGAPIISPGGVTVIPISKISVGFANGGVDFGAKKFSPDKNFGCGGGLGMSVTPLAFLVIDKNSKVELIPVDNGESSVDKTVELIEHLPEIISNIRNSLT